tara:strand:- start:3783 stop:3950 length:168 start_codon:yes stop_codon:yes gene_type:complete
MSKKKPKNVKPIINDGSCHIPLQWDIPKNVEKSRNIKPENVFEGYRKKKNIKSKK